MKHPARVLSSQSKAVPERIYLAPMVLVVDEFGIWPYDRDAATAFLTLVLDRYARGSIILTSNKGFGEWGELLGDTAIPSAILDAGPDPVIVPPLPEGGRGNGYSPRLGTGMEPIIERFTLPHHVVADPVMAGRHETAVAALKLGRSFIGAWDDRAFIDRLKERLEREPATL